MSIQPLVVRPGALSGLVPLERSRPKDASREEILLALSERERMLVSAIVECLQALRARAEIEMGKPYDGVVNPTSWGLDASEKAGLAGLMSAFRAATGVPFVEAVWV